MELDQIPLLLILGLAGELITDYITSLDFAIESVSNIIFRVGSRLCSNLSWQDMQCGSLSLEQGITELLSAPQLWHFVVLRRKYRFTTDIYTLRTLCC